jgi:hypothetical protein
VLTLLTQPAIGIIQLGKGESHIADYTETACFGLVGRMTASGRSLPLTSMLRGSAVGTQRTLVSK